MSWAVLYLWAVGMVLTAAVDHFLFREEPPSSSWIIINRVVTVLSWPLLPGCVVMYLVEKGALSLLRRVWTRKLQAAR